MKRIFICAVTLLPVSAIAAIDPYDLITPLVDKEQHPRVLNVIDLPELKDENPEPLLMPEGDFNKDGHPDLALVGVYEFPTGANHYFLLVGSLNSSHQAQALEFKEYSTPVYLHAPGTTGEADPGDQAFSISFCRDCAKGEDFYWNPKSSRFDRIAWTSKKRHEKKMVLIRPTNVPQPLVDESLKIVGALKDIQLYVADLKKRNGELGTRVDWDKNGEKKKQTLVTIFEKKEGKEKVYDRISVDLKTKKITKRRLKASDIFR